MSALVHQPSFLRQVSTIVATHNGTKEGSTTYSGLNLSKLRQCG
jgi:hypothetical protein